MTRWSDLPAARTYYLSLARTPGTDDATIDGEAAACVRVAKAGDRVLDAGCGHGRIAITLAEHRFETVGVDLDGGLLELARRRAPDLDWRLGDLADSTFIAGLGLFDLVLVAGNVLPLVATGTEPRVLSNLAARVRAEGLVLTGFGLDADHLPLPRAPFGLEEYDEWCADAGLSLVDRWATWDGDPYDDGGFAVSLHRRT